MPRIVIATDGCFALSHDAVMTYALRKGLTLHSVGKFFVMYDYARVPEEAWRQLQAREQAAQSDEEREAWLHEYNAAAFSIHDIARDDPDLVAVVEQLGDDAAGQLWSLTIVDVPDDVQWHVAECNGIEWVAENHRRWDVE
jgi:hypothetical protein